MRLDSVLRLPKDQITTLCLSNGFVVRELPRVHSSRRIEHAGFAVAMSDYEHYIHIVACED